MLIEPEQSKQASSKDAESKDAERIALIKAAIDEIRPNLQRDGGDCELVEVDGNKVKVKLTGACIFCSLASATLDGIQAKIVEKTGELMRLVPVAAAPGAGAPKAPPVKTMSRPIIKPPVERPVPAK